jgi:hypothetical protein
VFRTADSTGAPSQPMRILFLQEILRRGVLGQSYVISAAHTDADVEQAVEAARGAVPALRKALETGRPEELFTGRSVAPAHRLYAARDGCPRYSRSGDRADRPAGCGSALVLGRPQAGDRRLQRVAVLPDVRPQHPRAVARAVVGLLRGALLDRVRRVPEPGVPVVSG